MGVCRACTNAIVFFWQVIYFVIVPFKTVFVWAHQLLNSYYIEKKQPGIVFDFDAVVQQEMQEIVKDPLWQEYSMKGSTDDVLIEV